MVSKVREAHERRMRDALAAELLPLGREVAAERLAVAPSTVYKMVHRFRRRRSTVSPAA
jgi:transposase-like protein